MREVSGSATLQPAFKKKITRPKGVLSFHALRVGELLGQLNDAYFLPNGVALIWCYDAADINNEDPDPIGWKICHITPDGIVGDTVDDSIEMFRNLVCLPTTT